MFELAEILSTLSGEAPLSGAPVLLLRFRGCNLSCAYCDTPHKNELNYCLDAEELRQKIISATREHPGIRVLLTGGEPLLAGRQEELTDLITSLPGVFFYIETNGSIEINHPELVNCSYVVDWKTPSSGEAASFHMANLARLKPEKDCLKFVTAGQDLEFVLEKLACIEKINRHLPVYLSPQFQAITLKELAGFILEHKLAARLSIQLHKLIWKDEARGI